MIIYMHVSITVKHYINIYPLHQHIAHFCKQTWALPGWTFCNHLLEQGLETGVVRPDGSSTVPPTVIRRNSWWTTARNVEKTLI